MSTIPALLALADGSVFRGVSIGASGTGIGEVVFNTAMTGYQEILSDPSYARQIVTLTYPHIGNVGVNDEDDESSRVRASALVVRDVPARVSNWRAGASLPDYLRARGIVGIAGIDTRRLTRILREKGAQNGCVTVASTAAGDAEHALAQARAFPGLAGMDLAKEVSTERAYVWREGIWKPGTTGEPGTTDAAGSEGAARTDFPYHVVAFDYGVKRNILRMLAERGARVTVLPAQSPAAAALDLKPDGVFLSNGPGDPEPCDYAIRAVREILDRTRIPVFGICLGHQIMGLASGARTTKMKFGHHGANHPVKDLATSRVVITSQNHGFAVDPESLPANTRITHVSLFDGSLQGFERIDRPAFCFQGHPEASPGPRDIGYLFDRFVSMMQRART